MLLVIDVGNTNTVLGLFQEDRLVRDWRIATDINRTVDEHAVLFRQLFAISDLELTAVSGIIISCVVPPLLAPLEALGQTYFNVKPCVVGPGIKTGMPIKYDNPREVGADRIVNAVAAFERYRRSLIVVDFGTATTFDYISAQGEYVGGAISPGLVVATEALIQRASKLPKVEILQPPAVIARNTVNSIQSGIFHGYVGLVDGIIRKMREEAGETAFAVATGGNARLVAAGSETIDEIEPNLTLEGLKIIYNRNKTGF
ncbi:MAG: pantothenate kinase [Desulfuromonas sp.]|nr:MAG: pantothenate kinase [Desulfuromonas sp.]